MMRAGLGHTLGGLPHPFPLQSLTSPNLLFGLVFNSLFGVIKEMKKNPKNLPFISEVFSGPERTLPV